ncbi:hypothetical protein AAK894_14225 [Lachnospiraceae bacterium 46-61]
MFSQRYNTIDREKELIQQTTIEVAKVVTGEIMKAIMPILQEQQKQNNNISKKIEEKRVLFQY